MELFASLYRGVVFLGDSHDHKPSRIAILVDVGQTTTIASLKQEFLGLDPVHFSNFWKRIDFLSIV